MEKMSVHVNVRMSKNMSMPQKYACTYVCKVRQLLNLEYVSVTLADIHMIQTENDAAKPLKPLLFYYYHFVLLR